MTTATGWKVPATRSNGGGDFEKAPAGNHPAILVSIIDLGTQKVDGFQGAPAKMMRRAYFVWELVNERMSGSNRNHTIAIDLTVSLNEKAKLRKWIEARTGKPVPDGGEFDIAGELGQPCLLNVVVSPKGYPKIEGMSAVPKGMTIPNPTYKITATRIEDNKATGKIVVPEWVPYLYGENLFDVIKRASELDGVAVGLGDQPSQTGQTQPQTTPPNGAASTVPPPPPPRRRAVAEPSFYLDIGKPDVPTDVLVPMTRIKQLYETSRDVDWNEAAVCAPGAQDWTPFYTAIPDATKWIPF